MLNSIAWCIPPRVNTSPSQIKLRQLSVIIWLVLFFRTDVIVGGEIDLPACFRDNMVLQSGRIVIWGWSDHPAGEVEFCGRVVPWKNEPVSKTNKRRVRWEAAFENTTNSGSGELIIRAGIKPWLKELNVKQTVKLTNVHVGEVWLWAAKNAPRAPKAGLTPDENKTLQAQVRVFRSRMDDVVRVGAHSGAAWDPCQTNTVAAEACFFALRRASVLKDTHIGLIEVPEEDLLAAFPKMPDGPPKKNDWQNLDDVGLENSFRSANYAASNIFNAAVARHSNAVNQLKMRGIVTNATLLKWEDMNDFSRVRLVTVSNVQPLAVRGVIW